MTPGTPGNHGPGPGDSSTMTTVESPRARVLPWLSTLARLVLGGVWIAAGVPKITDLDASVRAVRAYALLPEAVVQIVGPGLPPAEILLGALLVLGVGVRVGAVISTVLMAAFVVGIASAWIRGLSIDCGCFGSGGALAPGAEPTYGRELARDGGLLVLALFLVRWPAGRWALDAVLTRKDPT